MKTRLTLSGVLLLALWYFPPPALGIRLCAFHWITGRDCPLCGVTRALFELAKGRWAEAIHLNALSPLALVMLFGLMWSGPWVGRLWGGGIAAFAVYGVFRMFFS